MTIIQFLFFVALLGAVVWIVYRDLTGVTRRPCERCEHYWRDDGEGTCKRDGIDDQRPLVTERDDGWFWSWAFGTCGKRGRNFFERMPPPSTPRRASAQSEDVQ